VDVGAERASRCLHELDEQAHDLLVAVVVADEAARAGDVPGDVVGQDGILAGSTGSPTTAALAVSAAAEECDHVGVLDFVTVNVVHPGSETLPLSIGSPLASGPALRLTMEYPGGWLIQWPGTRFRPIAAE
jgi:hypothetical protein